VVLRFQSLEVLLQWFVPISWSFFFLFLFFIQIVIMFKGTKDSCSASYADKKPISKRHPARFTSSWEKSNTPNP